MRLVLLLVACLLPAPVRAEEPPAPAPRMRDCMRVDEETGETIDPETEEEIGRYLDCLGQNVKGPWLVTVAERGDAAEVKKLLAHHADPNWFDRGNQETALIAAARNGHVAIVRALLAHGASVNVDGVNETALQAAATWGHVEVVDLLLARGADVEGRGSPRDIRETPLQAAAGAGRADIVARLIAHGADVKARCCQGNGYALLHFAARGGSAEVARLLIAHGAELDARALGGTTPLLEAARYRHSEVVRVLLDAGADLHLTRRVWRDEEESPLQVSVRGLADGHSTQDPVSMKALLAKGAQLEAWDAHAGLKQAAADGYVAMIQALLATGLLDAKDAAEAFTQTAAHGHPEAVAALLDLGFDPNAKDARGRTAVHAAYVDLCCEVEERTRVFKEIVRVLHAHGAGLDFVTENDGTISGVADRERFRRVLHELGIPPPE